MRLKFAFLGIASILLASHLWAEQSDQPTIKDRPTINRFGNADVIALLKAGMDNNVIIAKIKQAPDVDFKLETDDLVTLKKSGASPEIISAMLARVTPASESEPKVLPFQGSSGKIRPARQFWLPDKAERI